MPALLSKVQAKEKTAHREGHVSLTKVDDLSSPGSAESCRQMPVIKGKKTLQTCKDQQCVRSWNGGQAHRQQVTASEMRKH